MLVLVREQSRRVYQLKCQPGTVQSYQELPELASGEFAAVPPVPSVLAYSNIGCELCIALAVSAAPLVEPVHDVLADALALSFLALGLGKGSCFRHGDASFHNCLNWVNVVELPWR